MSNSDDARQMSRSSLARVFFDWNLKYLCASAIGLRILESTFKVEIFTLTFLWDVLPVFSYEMDKALLSLRSLSPWQPACGQTPLLHNECGFAPTRKPYQNQHRWRRNWTNGRWICELALCLCYWEMRLTSCIIHNMWISINPFK